MTESLAILGKFYLLDYIMILDYDLNGLIDQRGKISNVAPYDLFANIKKPTDH